MNKNKKIFIKTIQAHDKSAIKIISKIHKKNINDVTKEFSNKYMSYYCKETIKLGGFLIPFYCNDILIGFVIIEQKNLF